MRFGKNRKSGFGLLEVMISSMILVSVVGAVVALGSASVRGNLTASDKTTAYNLAQECLEKARQMRNTSWQDGTDWKTTLISDLANKVECKEAKVGDPEVIYSRIVDLREVPNAAIDGDPKMEKVDVTVTWAGVNGSQTVQAATYLTDWKAL